MFHVKRYFCPFLPIQNHLFLCGIRENCSFRTFDFMMCFLVNVTLLMIGRQTYFAVYDNAVNRKILFLCLCFI